MGRLRTPFRRRAAAGASLILVAGVMVVAPRPVRALTFNLTYDSSTSGAPVGFVTAFNDAISFYQTRFTDPVTINLHVGWGEIDGNSLNPGNLGQSLTNQQGLYTYAQVQNALESDSKSASDAMAIANLPVSYPISGTNFVMSNAEAKALGLLAGNASGIDGYVGFNSSANFTFDPNNRAIPGGFDFIGLAGHEITVVMGRYGLGQNGASSGRFSPIDLFRYSAPGVLDTSPANGTYFSIDGGITNINTFNGTGGGDLSDWKGLTLDPYNSGLAISTQLNESPGDLTEMDAIGWDAAVPEPASVGLTVVLAGGLLARRRHSRGPWL